MQGQYLSYALSTWSITWTDLQSQEWWMTSSPTPFSVQMAKTCPINNWVFYRQPLSFVTWSLPPFLGTWGIGTPGSGSWSRGWACGPPPRLRGPSWRISGRSCSSEHWSALVKPHIQPLRRQWSRICSPKIQGHEFWPCFISLFLSVLDWATLLVRLCDMCMTCNA